MKKLISVFVVVCSVFVVLVASSCSASQTKLTYEVDKQFNFDANADMSNSDSA